MKLDILSPYYWFLMAKKKSPKNPIQFSIPIISVGNINTGGSGKTPFIHFLVGEVRRKFPDKKIVIVSKSYKASLKYPQEVTELDLSRSDIFGDEPCLLKSIVDADVWSGPVKYKTLAAALRLKSYDLAIIDDGFSHRQIQRQLDIVLFDVSRSRAHYQIIPFGFMREPWPALKRASLVILTKLENQEKGRIHFFESEIKKYQTNILSLDFVNQLNLKNKNIFLVTGIGNPEALVQNLKQLGYKIVKAQLYQDHYKFPVTEQIKIWQEYLSLKADSELQIVTTSKDFIKMSYPDLKLNLKIIDLKISMTEEKLKVLHEKISQLF